MYKEDLKRVQSKEAMGSLTRVKMETFLKGLEENSQRYRETYSIIDLDLREQIKKATVKLVMPAYTDFVNTFSAVL